LRQQFQTLVAEHREQEQVLRKEKLKQETYLESVLNRYDEDMTKKQVEYDEIEKLYEEEKIQLADLREKFTPLEEEYLKIVEERRIEDAIRKMEEDTLNNKIKAALIIQSYWRGFKLRKGLVLKKKKGKGKGKGKGKKKK
jgi:IQ domain-containing protein D